MVGVFGRYFRYMPFDNEGNEFFEDASGRRVPMSERSRRETVGKRLSAAAAPYLARAQREEAESAATINAAPVAEIGGAPEDAGLARNREMIADLTALNAQLGGRLVTTIKSDTEPGSVAVILNHHDVINEGRMDNTVYGVDPKGGAFCARGFIGLLLTKVLDPDVILSQKDRAFDPSKSSLEGMVQFSQTPLDFVSNDEKQQAWSEAFDKTKKRAEEALAQERFEQEQPAHKNRAQEGIRDAIKGAMVPKTGEPGAVPPLAPPPSSVR